MILHNGKPAVAFNARRALERKPTASSNRPTLFQKAKNLAGAAKRIGQAAARGQKIAVSKEEADRRMAICQECEFFIGKSCMKCGCVIKFKARLETEHCPIAKW